MQLSHTLDGSECRIVFVDGERELDWFNAFIDAGAPIAVDTESTGLDIFSTGYSSPPSHQDTPLEILKARYARGEIDDEEFQRRRRELEK